MFHRLRSLRLLRALLGLLAAVMLLQGSAALLAATLGPRHAHAPSLPQAELLDLRRGVIVSQVYSVGDEHGPAQAWQRHHHAAAHDLITDPATQQADALGLCAALLTIWVVPHLAADGWALVHRQDEPPRDTPCAVVPDGVRERLERPPRGLPLT